jgi:hypothetical protein
MTVWLYVSVVGYVGAISLLVLTFPVPHFMHNAVDRLRDRMARSFLGVELAGPAFRVVDFLFISAVTITAVELYYVELVIPYASNQLFSH